MPSGIYSRLRMLAATRRSLTLLAVSLCLLSAGVCASRVAYSRMMVSSLSIGAASVIEGDGAGTMNLDFTVTLSPADPVQTVTVNFRTSTTAENNAQLANPATASPDPGADYVSQTGTVTFNAGDTTKTISVVVNKDCVSEASENLLVFLSNAVGANIITGTGAGRITTDDSRPLSIGNASVTEGDGAGTVNLDFTVTITGSPVTPESVAACGPVTVNFRTSTTAENNAQLANPATASPDAGADYVSQTGTVTFNAGFCWAIRQCG